MQFRLEDGVFFLSAAIIYTGGEMTTIKEDTLYRYISLETGTVLPNQKPHSETLNSTRGERYKRESGKVFTVGFSGRNKNFGG